MSSLPLTKSSVNSVLPPLGHDCTRNLSLQFIMSAGHSLCGSMVTCTFTVSPFLTNPLLGSTQYFLGSVVFILKAISSLPLLYSRIVAGIFSLSSTAPSRGEWKLGGGKASTSHVFLSRGEGG